MDTAELAHEIAAPIGRAGMAYYFCPAAKTKAGDLGIDLFSFYATGRGGVMGDVDPKAVEAAFWFFKDGLIESLVVQGQRTLTLTAAADAHLEVATELAHLTLGGVDRATLEAFVEAARSLGASLPLGCWPLVDGFVARVDGLDLEAEAYLWIVVLRELRGGLHIDATIAEGVSPAAACQLDRQGISYEMHGFGDADRSDETPELTAQWEAAEAETTATMAELLSVLSEAQRAALAAGTKAITDAVGSL